MYVITGDQKNRITDNNNTRLSLFKRCFLSWGVFRWLFYYLIVSRCILHTCKTKMDPRCYMKECFGSDSCVPTPSHSGQSIHALHDRWGGKKNPQTEYSSHCNRFNLFCQNRLRYFASLLECCISLIPPSLSPFPIIAIWHSLFHCQSGQHGCSIDLFVPIAHCPPPRWRHMIIHHG